MASLTNWLAVPNPPECCEDRDCASPGLGGDARAVSVDVTPIADYRKGDEFDLILLATKAQDALDIAPRLGPLLAPGGVLLPIQNRGVARMVADCRGEDKVLGRLNSGFAL